MAAAPRCARGGRGVLVAAALLAAATCPPPSANAAATALLVGRCGPAFAAGGAEGALDRPAAPESIYGYPGAGSGLGACSAPLMEVRALARVAGPLAHVAVNHSFTNDQAVAIEGASVVLSLPAGAELLGLEAAVGDGAAPVVASIRAKGEDISSSPCPRAAMGFGLYDAPSSPQGVLRVPVGQVPRGGIVTVRFEYAQELRARPRPPPPNGGPGERRLGAPAPAFRLTLPAPSSYAGRRGRGRPTDVVVLELRASADQPFASVTSPTPDVVSEVLDASGDGGSGSAGAAVSKVARLTSTVLQDIAVDIEFPSVAQTPTAADSGGDGGADEGQVGSFLPGLILQRHPRTSRIAAAVALPASMGHVGSDMYEFIFALDRSPSMRGVRLARSQAAAHSFFRSLPVGVRFNLAGFDKADPAALLFPHSQPLGQESFDLASLHIEALTAVPAPPPAPGAPAAASPPVAGGVVALLRAAFQDAGRAEGTQLRVVVVTDRQPPDSEEAARLVAGACARDCRLGVVGIGWGASPQFVEGVSKAGHGTAAFAAERGGAAALERALVSQLEEGLLPTVRDVEVDWEAFWPLGDAPAAGECSRAASGEASSEVCASGEGAARRILRAPLPPPDVGAGGRLLALALLGEANDAGDGGALRLSAVVAGRRRSFVIGGEAARSAAAEGTSAAAQALAAAALARAGGDDFGGSAKDKSAWVRAMGLEHRLATPETEWVVPAAAAGPAEGGVAPAAGGSAAFQAVHCVAARSSGPSVMDVPYTDPSSGATAPTVELSVRRPPSKTASPGAALGGAAPANGSLLSLLDITALGASLSLRPPASRADRYLPPSPLDDLGHAAAEHRAGAAADRAVAEPPARAAGAGSPGLSLRSFVKVSQSMSMVDLRHLSGGIGGAPDAGPVHLGRGLGVGLGLASDLDFGVLDAERPLPMPKGAPLDGAPDVAAKLSTRDMSRLRVSSPPLEVARSDPAGAAIGRVGAQLSLLDVLSVGASLSVRPPPRGAAADQYPRRVGALSALDSVFLGSSLSVGRHHVAQRTMSLYGSRRSMDFVDDVGFDDLGFAHGGSPPSSAPGPSPAVSLRCFAKMGSAISVVQAATLGAAGAKLSMLDAQSLGASLSMRPIGAGQRRPPLAAERRGAADLASSLSLRHFSERPAGAARLSAFDDAFGDPWAGAGGRGDGDALGFGYGSIGKETRYGGAFADVADRAPVGGGLPGPRFPAAWVCVRIAGGVYAPIVGVFRTGGACQSRQEQVRVAWATGPSTRQPAALHLATGPLPGSAEAPRIGELQAPTQAARAAADARQAGGRAPPASRGPPSNELWLTVLVSRTCELTVQARHSAANSGPIGYDAFPEEMSEPLLQAALPELAAGGESQGAAGAAAQLRSSLRAAMAARRGGADGSAAGGDATAAQGARAVAEPVEAVVETAAGDLDGFSGGGLAGSALGDEAEEASAFRAISRAQHFDGAFDLGGLPGGAAAVGGLRIPLLEALAAAWSPEGAGGLGLGRAAAHTAAALAALQGRHASLRSSWALAAAKASSWLEASAARASGCGVSAVDCVEAADLAVARWRR